MNRTIGLASLALLPALAWPASHDIKTFILEHDLNRDGAVSKEEFAKERDRGFALIDLDGSGGLSKVEYVEEYRGRLMQRNPDAKEIERQMKQAEVRFGVLDSNKDGQISRAEFTYSGWRMFIEHDYDKDGTVSAKDDVDKPQGG